MSYDVFRKTRLIREGSSIIDSVEIENSGDYRVTGS